MILNSSRHPIISAAFWMIGALTSFSTMAVCGRELSSEVGTFQILFFRSGVGLLVIVFLLWRSGWRQILTRTPGLHLLRNLAHFGGQFGWFYGIAFIPFAEVFAIEFTTPIWTVGLAVLFLKERLTKTRIATIVCGITGVLIILRPGLAIINPASLAVLAGALGFAVTYTVTKKLSSSTSPLAILFYMTLVQLPLGLIPALNSWVVPSPRLWPWVALVGIGALSAHYCVVRALSLVDAIAAVPMDFLRLPLIALVGFIFYNETLEWFVPVGALIMFSGNFLNILMEHRQKTNPG
ncbi:MAG: DMT family transporter [SAR324 cluster bacterium]|nr:DMT family transporter [SAR324 cluster bacterium]